ncbi:hypothetical protein ACFROC_26410 [Nocardia tengchongensis]|uniref:hypothetical protein n=1 Tax=Nocardia tengchongensis TaxID=2055889 RepID=UPI0036B2F488
MTTKIPRRQRRRVPVAVTVAILAALAAAPLAACSRDGGPAAPLPSATGGSIGGSAVPTVPGTSAPGASTTSAPADFPYEPLWPFRDRAEAAAWQQDSASGHQPWHLDPAATAQSFTQHYLGFTSLDKIVKVATEGDQSRVSVGFGNPNGVAVVAAVIHLVRLGNGDTAPWEVVGTEDTALTLTAPRYAATVHSPIAVGGTITGVDESLRVRVLRSDRDQPVGQSTPIPAGGAGSPWTTTVSVPDACPATLTIVVATGGHVSEVERFAVTGAHC